MLYVVFEMISVAAARIAFKKLLESVGANWWFSLVEKAMPTSKYKRLLAAFILFVVGT